MHVYRVFGVAFIWRALPPPHTCASTAIGMAAPGRPIVFGVLCVATLLAQTIEGASTSLRSRLIDQTQKCSAADPPRAVAKAGRPTEHQARIAPLGTLGQGAVRRHRIADPVEEIIRKYTDKQRDMKREK